MSDQRERITPEELREQESDGHKPLVIDVRDASAFAAGHVSGAVNIPLDDLPQKLAELAPGQPIVTYCNGGTRCERAATLLNEHGYEARALAGGYPGWKKAGLPVEEAGES